MNLHSLQIFQHRLIRSESDHNNYHFKWHNFHIQAITQNVDLFNSKYKTNKKHIDDDRLAMITTSAINIYSIHVHFLTAP